MMNSIAFVVTVVVNFFTFGFSLTPEQCSSQLNQDLLFSLASTIAEKAVDILVPSKFARVSKGYLIKIGEEDDGVKSGGGTNTFGSYGTFYFDATEVLPEGMCDLSTNHSGSVGQLCFSDGSKNRTFSFLLGHFDAIAFVGCTPPEMRFFSHDVVINGRLTENYPYFPGQNFGDSISNKNINLSSTTSVFDQPSVVIHSADGKAAEIVADAYVNSDGGLKRSDVSIRGIDGDIVKLWDRSGCKSWRETQPDIFSFIARMTGPAGGVADPAYAKYKLSYWPVYLFFADDEQKPVAPLRPTLKPRFSSATMDETSTLKTSYENLVELVVTSFVKNKSAKYVSTLSLDFEAEGNYDDWDVVLAKKNNDSFIAPTRDGTYGMPVLRSADGYLYKTTTAVVLVGVLHSKAIGAAYSSVGVDVLSAMTAKVSAAHWFFDTDLEGSARRYFDEGTAGGSGVANAYADLLFAVEVLPPGACKVIDASAGKWCIEFNATAANVVRPLIAGGERIYSLESTGVGPAANVTLSSRLLIFDLPAQ